MNKLKVLALSLVTALLASVTNAQAQANFLALATIFNGATQTITSNAAGLPVQVPAGGNLTNLQALDVIALAGSSQGTGAAITATKFVHQLTGANGTLAATFAATPLFPICHLFMNTTAGVAVLYPATGGSINAGGANAAFSALTGIKPILCCTTAADTWICS